MVGVFRETDRRQYERVNDGQLKQRVAGGCLMEDLQIEPQEIVANNKLGIEAQSGELVQSEGQAVSTRARQRCVSAHGSELEDVALMGDLGVQQQRAAHQDTELDSLPWLSWCGARLHAFPAQHSQRVAELSKLLMPDCSRPDRAGCCCPAQVLATGGEICGIGVL